MLKWLKLFKMLFTNSFKNKLNLQKFTKISQKIALEPSATKKILFLENFPRPFKVSFLEKKNNMFFNALGLRGGGQFELVKYHRPPKMTPPLIVHFGPGRNPDFWALLERYGIFSHVRP